MKGTQKIHQIFTNPLADQKILHRQFPCYLELNFDNCVYVTESLSFSTCSHLLRLSSDDFGSNNVLEDVSDEFEDEYNETKASTLIRQGDITVVKTSDDFPCYLVQLSCNPYFTSKEEKGDYKITFFPNHKVVKGNYIELHKETKGGDLYYVD